MRHQQTLRGRVGLVTGATSGIGRGISLRLAQEGARLVLAGRNERSLQTVQKEASEYGQEIIAHCVDLAAGKDVEELIHRMKGQFRGLDLLVHSAGIIRLATTELARPDDLDEQYRVNVRAPYRLTHGLLGLVKPARGQVIFINSSAAIHPGVASAQYAATKSAMRALADSLRMELNPMGVRVTSIFAGRTATPMQESVHRFEGRPYEPSDFIQPEDIAEVVVAALNLPRTAEVTDIHIRPCKAPAFRRRSTEDKELIP